MSRGIPALEANRLVDLVIDSKHARILIASDPHNTDRIVGWIVYLPNVPGRRVVVYLYTRDQYRGHGVARALFEHAFPRGGGKIIYTFSGPDAGTLLQKFPATHIPVTELLNS